MSEGKTSILCADLVGAEKLQARLAASEVTHALGRCEKRITQAAESYRGRIVRTSPLRVIAYFAEADAAVHAAVEMQRRIVALPPLSGVVLAARIGVCLGHAESELGYFEGEEDNAAARLAALAAPGQVLLSVPKRAAAPRWEGLVADSRAELSLSCGKRRLGVFEIDWRNSGSAHLKPSTAADAGDGLTLFLDAGGVTLELNASRPQLSIGRQAGCGLPLKSSHVSRAHARIERRGDAFVLIDSSTNGTYVELAGGEQRIRRGECVLHGRGRIGFGGKPGAEGIEYVEFRFGDPA
ncbi:MAG: FHA domain-containing protein [Rhodocyclales bacterium]|nr:FHA domain-containing protein [Rhodocyclales bacterium]